MTLGITSLSETPLSTQKAAAAAGAYTLTVSPATVAIVGQSVTLRAARQLAVSPGTVAITGQSVTLRAARQLLVSPATVAITGQSVTLRAARQLVVSPATVAITGQSVTLRAARQLLVSPATVAITGQSVDLRTVRQLSVSPGIVAITGQSVDLTYTPAVGAYTLTVTPGVVAITGQSVNLTYVPIVADTGRGGKLYRPRRRRAPQYRTIETQREWLALLRETGVIAPDTPARQAPAEPDTIEAIDDWQQRLAARHERIGAAVAELQARAQNSARAARLLEEQIALRQVVAHLASVQARIESEEEEIELLLLAA